MSTFLNQQTFAVAPIMSGANIASASIPLSSVVGGTSLPTLAATQTWTGVDTFTQTVHAPSYTISDANGNVFVGTGLNASTFTVTGNVGIGVNSFGSMTTASANMAIGGYAFAQLVTGTKNVALGDQSGANVGGGNNNTFLGANSGLAAFDGPFSNSTAVGYGSIVSDDNQIVIGRSSETTFIPGNLQLTLNGATDGYVLTSDADGNATWAAGGGGGGDAYLAADQTWTGINTYTTAPVFSATGSALQITTGAVDGYVLTSDGSGNCSWAASSSPLGATVSTTNATATTLATIAVPSNQSVIITGYVVARNSSGTINDSTGGQFICTAVNTAGTVALASTPSVIVQATSTGSFNVVVSGTNLIVQVTGIAATNYSWKASYSVVVI